MGLKSQAYNKAVLLAAKSAAGTLLSSRPKPRRYKA